MSAQRQRTLAGFALAASLLLWLGMFLLLFYIPGLAAAWAEFGAAISPPQQLLVFLSQIAGQNAWRILPSLLLGTAIAIWWRLDAERKIHALDRTRPL